MSSCPGEGTLRLLGTDALGDATYAAIEQHVEGCPECKAVLERLAHRRPDPTVRLAWPGAMAAHPGFRDPVRAGPGCHGRGLPGDRDGPGSSGRPEGPSGSLGAGRELWRLAAAGCARRARSRASGTPTSCRSTITARRTGGSSWCSNTSPAAPSSNGWRNPFRRGPRPG